ncbi:MAG: glycosyltransferase family 2 protein [Paludibacter sp.]|nr:glycosyltransferase family 2 protein [Paludibacter sp.]
MSHIAILITCFNRREITLKCLQHLFEIKNDVDVYLVDDNSTDGTSELILKFFPHVNVIQGDGNLYWNRGMYLAWKQASKKDYDYYLWLNDDTFLYNNCLNELLFCSQIAKGLAIISGIIESHDKTEILYGGTNTNKKLLVPNGSMQNITNMNGNIVLVPKSVYNVLGNFDPIYHHDLGDVDYGLRAIENNIPVFTSRVAVGSGERNDFCRVRLWNSTIFKRFNKLYSPLGNHPSINFYFRHKHYGIINAVFYYIHIHLINLLPDHVIKVVSGLKYLK